MREAIKFFGEGLPYLKTSGLKGKLIAIEGTDGVGRSTQIDLLEEWLQVQGYAVTVSGWTRSNLMRRSIEMAKNGNMLNRMTFSLLYATDFADRTEHHIIPPLKAGALVLADRYIYTAFARDVARGVDPTWVRGLYQFAVKPTTGFYFRISLDEAMKRILGGREAIKYYEAGMDLRISEDIEESFRIFQGRIIEEYEKMVQEYGLVVIDASQSIEEQQVQMRGIVLEALEGTKKTRIRKWVDLGSMVRKVSPV